MEAASRLYGGSALLFYWDVNLGCDLRIRIMLNGVKRRDDVMDVMYAVTALTVKNT